MYKVNHVWIFPYFIKPLPNNKYSDMTKLKAFADKKLNFAKVTIFLWDRVENTVGKEENAAMFSKAFFLRII